MSGAVRRLERLLAERQQRAKIVLCVENDWRGEPWVPALNSPQVQRAIASGQNVIVVKYIDDWLGTDGRTSDVPARSPRGTEAGAVPGAAV